MASRQRARRDLAFRPILGFEDGPRRRSYPASFFRSVDSSHGAKTLVRRSPSGAWFRIPDSTSLHPRQNQLVLASQSGCPNDSRTTLAAFANVKALSWRSRRFCGIKCPFGKPTQTGLRLSAQTFTSGFPGNVNRFRVEARNLGQSDSTSASTPTRFGWAFSEESLQLARR